MTSGLHSELQPDFQDCNAISRYSLPVSCINEINAAINAAIDDVYFLECDSKYFYPSFIN